MRLLVVDELDVVRMGLRSVLVARGWVDRCLTADSAAEAVALARRYEPHVALVDALIGGDFGVDVCLRIRRAAPVTRVLLMAGEAGPTPRAARAAGAAGVVAKAASVEQIACALWRVRRGRPTGERPQAPPSRARLSRRERDVVGLIARGATNRQIAARLQLSAHTVKQHTSSLYRKLDARNRAEAVQRAWEVGLLEAPAGAAPAAAGERAAGVAPLLADAPAALALPAAATGGER
ncbi:MAG: response regulator transcription factor [Actinobacteria bacterium]|nr:response regulator transcription factor [Actinomycetota bacterium]